MEERSTADLDLGATVDALCWQPDQRSSVLRILEELCQDADTIRYRQEVLADLLDNQGLASGLERLIPDIASLMRYHKPREEAQLLYEVTWRLGELESYCGCIDRLAGLFDKNGGSINSRALDRLRDHVQSVREDPVYNNLNRELPELMSHVRGIASVTVGINLDQDLQPQAATLLRINRKRFHGSSHTLLGRLFGGSKAGVWEGLTPLHSVPDSGAGEERSPYVRPIMVPLFRDLSNLLDRSCRPIAAALERYTRINSAALAKVAEELAFYLGATRLIRRIQGLGLQMCRPEIAQADDKACVLADGYNINLALRFAAQEGADLKRRIVCNDVELGKSADVFVLTGPNRGGKTTYMKAVGQALILAQAGLHVPARSARISPADGIFTHFPAQEHPELDTGRLGEEAQRLRELFTAATPTSLILLNESLSTTTSGEGLILARDVLRALSLLGARAIYTTHLHELAREIGPPNGEGGDWGRIASLVSTVEDGTGNQNSGAERPVRPTFKILPGQPAGYSYARQIAEKYGVSYRQLEELLRKRGLIS